MRRKVKEIAGLLKGAEREEHVLEKPNRAGEGQKKTELKDGKKFLLAYFLYKCAQAGEEMGYW